jgi:NAD(P)-dependent dehydrogenase (short-subunit alcohol dehydrogenase family)
MSDYIDTLFSLKGRTAIITGGSRGIGAGIALGFLNAGANIICVSRSEKTELNELQEHYKKCDITDAQQFDAICKQTSELYGGIDILVNAAGISLPSDDTCSKFERFSKTLSVNLTSTYQCCEIATESMRNGGAIINITSIGSILGFPDNPGYVASKGGVRALTKALAEDLSPKNIRVNNIAPGYTKTEMTHKSFTDLDLNKQRVERMMIKRWGSVEDIAAAAIFLASNASSYITGIDLMVDGGWTAKGI